MKPMEAGKSWMRKGKGKKSMCKILNKVVNACACFNVSIVLILEGCHPHTGWLFQPNLPYLEPSWDQIICTLRCTLKLIGLYILLCIQFYLGFSTCEVGNKASQILTAMLVDGVNNGMLQKAQKCN